MTNTLEIHPIHVDDQQTQYRISLPQIRVTVESVTISNEALSQCIDSILECGVTRYDLPQTYRWVLDVSDNIAELTCAADQ